MDIINYEALGGRLRRIRQDKKLTQEQLAELVGVSHSFIGHIERGTRKASLETLVLLCKQLEISTDYLLQDSLPCQSFTLPEQLTPQQCAAMADILYTLGQSIAEWHHHHK